MSTGTENIVFNRLFDPGTHWDYWVKYPFYPGYAAVGIVEAVGAKVTTLQIGDRVAFRQGHRSHANVAEDGAYKIPATLPLEKAVWFALAKIAFMGAMMAEYRLGDRVLIIGAGPIGQMSLRWARAAGAASIVIVDALCNRLVLAEAGKATAVISTSIEQARTQALAANDGKLPRVVIDSTGNATVFATALTLAADRGRIVVLGDTGQPAKQTLTGEVILRGLTIVGAHDDLNTAEWNERTITQLFFSLSSTGRFALEGLNSHVFNPADCVEAYTVANRDRASTMGIMFDWSKAGPEETR
jgi:threonine dehydrogenase-like Zn-dependent dehydrogenase